MAHVSLTVCLIAYGFATWRDIGRFKAFVSLEDTASRQAHMRAWLLRSVIAFGLVSLGVLAMMGRYDALVFAPIEFQPIAEPLRAALERLNSERLVRFLAAFGIGTALSTAIGIIVARRNFRAPAPINALLPRNAKERWLAFALSLNAGISEELFFRIVLPLALMAITGEALSAILFANLLFGLAHRYQGWLGVLTTMAIGLVMSMLCLLFLNVWVAVGVHILLDLNALLFRPMILELWSRDRPARTRPAVHSELHR